MAGRIAVQRAPCASGFGTCHAGFNSIFFQFGLSPFALHAASPSRPWYVDPSHVPLVFHAAALARRRRRPRS